MELKKWEIKIERRPWQIAVRRTSPEQLATHASIHFGNQEWTGKVSRTHTDFQLVKDIRNLLIRKNGPMKLVRVQIEGEEDLETRVLPDSSVEEILGAAVARRNMEEIESFTPLVESVLLDDGVTYKFEEDDADFRKDEH